MTADRSTSPVPIRQVRVGAAGAGPYALTTGPDEALWVTAMGTDRIGRISPDGQIHEFVLPDRDARPHAIVADPDGGCWLSQWGTSGVAHITAEGDVREVALPASSEPHGLTIGPDGALWVALEIGAVTRIDR